MNQFEALHCIRQIAQETNGEVVYGLGRQAVLRTISQRLIREFNDTINGFNDDGWSILNCDDAQDIAVAVNSSKNLSTDTNTVFFVGGILRVKASMLLQKIRVSFYVLKWRRLFY